ncbi:ParB/RepB/Spo0J family partition protein [Leucobacter viscericola]|nr:ParB/RepB/Spo0J family partition protein [Leucobacter viscericola]
MTPLALQRAGVVVERNQRVDSTAIHVGVEDVLVADRYRRDLGDIADLKASIVEVGLLNPITVREWHGGYRLVAGERRLTAFKALGLAEIPARVARDIADARDALVAERDENTARKEMLPSEKASLGMAIEEMEKPAAKERQAASLIKARDARWNSLSGSRDPDREKEVRARDVAAEAVGLGPASYRRIKNLITTAADDTNPEPLREAAREGIENIDAGGPIRGEYDRVKELRQKESTVTVEPATKRDEADAWHAELAARYPLPRIAFEAEGHERHENAESFARAASYHGAKYRFNEKSYAKHAAQSADWLERSSMNLEVAVDVLSHIDFSTITPEQALEALQRIEAVPRQLNLYIRSLKGITNEQ